MRLEKAELANDILKVTLIGSLDIAGAGEIDMPFSIISGSRNKVILDMSKVTFLASIGIRVLVKAARTIGSKGGRFVVFGATEEARKILRSTGIDTIIPIVATEADAMAECSR